MKKKKLVETPMSVIDDKRLHNEKLSYEEFVILLSVNEELDFEIDSVLYSIVHNPPKIFIFMNVVYENGKYTYDKFEGYSNFEELLQNVKIGGKAISDIWDNITLK